MNITLFKLTDRGGRSKFRTKCTLAIDVKVITHETPRAQQTESAPLLPSGKDLVSILSNFGIFKTLFVVLPEPLNASCAFVPIPQIVTPCTLDSSSHIVPVAISHSLQCEELRKV